MKLKLLLYLAIAFAVFANIHPPFVLAQENCQPLLNGGQTDRQYCATHAPDQPTATPAPVATAPQKTKGGQTVYPTPKTKETPSTGPEEWAFPLLFVLAGSGFFLRNKAKT